MRRSLWVAVTALAILVGGGCERWTDAQGKSSGAPKAGAALLYIDPGYDDVGPGRLETLTPEQVGRFIEAQILMLRDAAVLETALEPATVERLITDLGEYDRTIWSEEAIRARAERIAAEKGRLLGKGAAAEQAARLGDLLDVRRAGNSTIIVVQLKGDASQLAVDLVNSVVDAYMLSCKERRLGVHMRAMLALERQFNDTAARTARARNALETWLSNQGREVSVGDTTDLEQRVALLQRAHLDAEIAYIEAALTHQQLAAEEEDQKVTPEIELQIQTDPVIAQLTAMENELLVQKAALPPAAEGAPGPALAPVLSRLKAVQARKESRRAELSRVLVACRAMAAQRSYAMAEQKLQQISQEYERAKADAQQAAVNRLRYEQLREEYEDVSREAKTLGDAMAEFMLESDLDRQRVLIMSPARPR